MANEISLISGQQSSAADTIEIFYTAPSDHSVKITAFTASNNTESNKTYKAYIYDISGDSEGAALPRKIVVRDRFDLGSPLLGHTIPQGGTLRLESSAADSLIFRATGQEV